MILYDKQTVHILGSHCLRDVHVHVLYHTWDDWHTELSNKRIFTLA